MKVKKEKKQIKLTHKKSTKKADIKKEKIDNSLATRMVNMAASILKKAKSAAFTVKTKVIKALKMKPVKNDHKATVEKKMKAEMARSKAAAAKQEAEHKAELAKFAKEEALFMKQQKMEHAKMVKAGKL